MDEQSEFNFTQRDEIPLARKGDPVTSHIAAEKLVESGKWRGQKGVVLTWMREHKIDKDHSLTASEMARESNIRHPVCHKRLPDLEAAGWVRKCVKRICKVTGELCWTWCLTTAEERAALSRVA
ncbi:MAG TPA: hypothetical protein VNW90_25235 [Acetobacteraceae bacterium]|jgi:hypothetical protein|nr:hypothetical protein [Acetobacteraceae bacterium]